MLMLAEAVRFERTCPEGAVAFQATQLPVLKTGGGPSACTLPKSGGKGRVSNPHVPKDRPASNRPPLGRSSAYLSVLESRPGLEPGKIGFAARRLDHFGIRLLAPQG